MNEMKPTAKAAKTVAPVPVWLLAKITSCSGRGRPRAGRRRQPGPASPRPPLPGPARRRRGASSSTGPRRARAPRAGPRPAAWSRPLPQQGLHLVEEELLVHRAAVVRGDLAGPVDQHRLGIATHVEAAELRAIGVAELRVGEAEAADEVVG